MSEPTSSSFKGRRITVVGLGLFGGGAATARYLARRGAVVTVTDLRTAQELAPALRELGDVKLDFVLGEHRLEDFTRSDLVVANPAVPPKSKFLEAARASGVPVTSETALFLAACPARIAAVTGTQGKSSTCYTLAQLLQASGFSVHLGGNIGHSLLESAEAMKPDDIAVIELSSYQLEALPTGPSIAALGARVEAVAVTNVLADHLERHGTLENYAAAKRRILELVDRAHGTEAHCAGTASDGRALDRELGALQHKGRDLGARSRGEREAPLSGDRDGAARRSTARELGRVEHRNHTGGFAVLSAEDPRLARWRDAGIDRVDVFESRASDIGLNFERGRFRLDREVLGEVGDLRLPGEFQRLNTLIALGLARLLGAESSALAAAIGGLGAMPHRLEDLGRRRGHRVWDNGVSTTPDSTLSVLSSLAPGYTLMLGGKAKSLPLDALLAASRGRVRRVITFGAASATFGTAFREAGFETWPADTVETAVERAFEKMEPDEALLFSPACASFDAYLNFRERALAFRRALPPLDLEAPSHAT